MILVVILSLVTFSQYYFSMTYRLLLAADQLVFVQMIVQSITLVLNLVICFIAVRFNLSIHIYKFLTSVFFLIQPVIYMSVVKHRYKIQWLAEKVNWRNNELFMTLAKQSMTIYLFHQQIIYFTISCFNGKINPYLNVIVK